MARHATHRLLWPSAIAAALSSAFLAVNPRLEMGVNDDQLYAWMARVLALTGQFHYDNWTMAMVGVHALWGALLIRILGFSFYALRLGTLVVGIGCAWIVYAICRRLLLPPTISGFTALAVGLSPVSIVLTASFMTDLSGMFLFLLAIYFALRCAQAQKGKEPTAWILALAIAAFMAGTVRQFYWLLPLLLIGALLLTHGKNLRLLAVGVVVVLLSGVCDLATLHWYNSVPGHVHEILRPMELDWHAITDTARVGEFSVLTVLVLCLPLPASALGVRRVWKSAAMASLFTGPILALSVLHPSLVKPPWFSDLFTPYGALNPGLVIAGERPIVFPDWARITCGVFLWFATSVTVTAIIQAIRSNVTLPVLAVLRRRIGEPWTQFVLIAWPFTIAYFLFLLQRRMTGRVTFDRYLLPVAAVTLITMALAYNAWIAKSVTTIGWICLLLGSLIGVFVGHDWFAVNRAILAAANQVTARNIPRNCVSGGYEYDSWTELEDRGSFPPVLPAQSTVPAGGYYLSKLTPDITPCYYVVLSPQPGLDKSVFSPVPYQTWFSPRHRFVLIQRNMLCPAQCSR